MTPPDPQQVAEIAGRLSPNEKAILTRVIAGARLPYASRAEDYFRQRMRRMGLIHVVRNPRRWQALPLGLAIDDHLKGTHHD